MSDGHSIRIADRAVIYLMPNDDVPEASPLPVGYDFFEDLVWRRHPRMRRVLTTLIRPHPLYYGLLHWSDGTDLDALDLAVASGESAAAGFSSALLVEVRSINCRHCEAGLRVAAPDGGNPLVTTALVQNHTFVRDCPVCGLPLGLLVVELFDQTL
jgi:hypothetical protein